MQTERVKSDPPAVRRAPEAGLGAGLHLSAQKAPLVDPLRFLHTGAQRFYARIPDEGIEVAGQGWAWEFHTQGANRFDDAQTAAQNFFAAASTTSSDLHKYDLTPRLWGGFAFQPVGEEVDQPPGTQAAFPDARWFMPARQYLRRRNDAYYLAARPAHQRAGGRPDIDPGLTMIPGADAHAAEFPTITLHAEDESQWSSEAALALRDILGGEFRKLVLARSLRLRFRDPLSIPALLDALRNLHPEATLCAFELAQDDWFITATPERLLKLRGGRVETHGVAGTIGRGASATEDTSRRQHLLGSAKEQEEHDLVVASILESMAPFCLNIQHAPRPEILEAGGFYHLVTPIHGQARSEHHLFALAAALHPTAAVGGFPRRSSLEWLARHETLQRGWYAAPVGYVDSNGEGSLFVAIRSGRFSGNQATLYAGAGFVRGSDAQAEWSETALKLHTLLDALRGEHVKTC